MSKKRASTPPPTPAKKPKSSSKSVPTVRELAEKALKLAAKANKGIEKKAIDFAGNTTVGTTASALHFTAIAQGTTQNQRIGNSVYMSGMAINFYWFIAPAAITTRIRFVIFRDTQTVSDNVTFGWTTLMDNSSIMAMVNRGSFRNRFKIMYDKTETLNASDNYGNNHMKIYLPIKKTIEYNGTANTDIQKNGIYGLVISDDNTDQPAFNYYARMYYHDS